MPDIKYHPSIKVTDIPHRISKLPVHRGYPVPWFVAWDGATPELRSADAQKMVLAINKKLCWVCGEALGKWITFVLGPMCGINRVSAEPPSHHECAQFSAINCPFLNNPNFERRTNDNWHEKLKAKPMAGVALLHNPGVTLLWVTRAYQLLKVKNGYLFRIDGAKEVEWYCRGRLAIRREVVAAVERGFPNLLKICTKDPGNTEAELRKALAKLETLYPEI